MDYAEIKQSISSKWQLFPPNIGIHSSISLCMQQQYK
jgi:hypothetical protein